MKQAAFISNLDGTQRPTREKLALTMLMPYPNESDTLADAFKRHSRASSGLELPGVLIAHNGSTDGLLKSESTWVVVCTSADFWLNNLEENSQSTLGPNRRSRVAQFRIQKSAGKQIEGSSC